MLRYLVFKLFALISSLVSVSKGYCNLCLVFNIIHIIRSVCDDQRSSSLVVKAWGQWMVSIGLRFEPSGKHSEDIQTLGRPSGPGVRTCQPMGMRVRP